MSKFLTAKDIKESLSKVPDNAHISCRTLDRSDVTYVTISGIRYNEETNTVQFISGGETRSLRGDAIKFVVEEMFHNTGLLTFIPSTIVYMRERDITSKTYKMKFVTDHHDINAIKSVIKNSGIYTPEEFFKEACKIFTNIIPNRGVKMCNMRFSEDKENIEFELKFDLNINKGENNEE